MISKLFDIGDIVALASHPYFKNGTYVVISGDHLTLSPLMAVCEVYKASYKFAGRKTETFKYKCMWYSTKSNDFVFGEINESDLKLIFKSKATINKNMLSRGQKVLFKTTSIELGKKKSSLSYDDAFLSESNGSATITSLLTYLPPVLQIVDYKDHVTRHQLTNKSKAEIRKVSSVDVKVAYFNPSDDKFAEATLPIELLELLIELEERTLCLIKLAIKASRHLKISNGNKTTIIKPRNLTYRCGQYFLRGYDLLTNKIEELHLETKVSINPEKKPILAKAPKFNIAKDPASATPEYIKKELIDAIDAANATKSFIRIKYKNRNDKLSNRTLSNYELITVKEGKLDVTYLAAHCLLRKDKRHFRIDRIQNLEQINLSYI